MDMTVAIDKLDKIGIDGVRQELSGRGIPEASIATILQVLAEPSLGALRPVFANSETGLKGIEELERVFHLLGKTTLRNEVRFDITLARGLTYYTGCIFEVAAKDVKMGSIGGGGRYADLTGVFGMPGLSGVGISFGADRIYDVLESLERFPANLSETVPALFVAFDEATHVYAFECVTRVRAAGCAAELFPEPGKLKKQFEYAAKRNIPWVIIVGETEMASGMLTVKNQISGEQRNMTVEELIETISQ